MPIGSTPPRASRNPSIDAGTGGASRPWSGEPTVIVVTGGEPPDVALVAGELAGVADDAVVVAADSGIEHALALGLSIDHAIGDFDSVDLTVLAQVEAAGAEVRRYPGDKDATDLELALDLAEQLGARRVVMVGGHGGRLDHFLANALVLAAPRYANLVVDAVMGRARVHVARPWAPSVVRGAPGDVVTLLPVHGPAEGVVTDGLAFPLDRETLIEGTTRGVSNVLLGERAEVRLTAGCLLLVQPGPDGRTADGTDADGPGAAVGTDPRLTRPAAPTPSPHPGDPT